MLWFHIVIRNRPLTASEPPAAASASTASGRSGANPNAAIAAPQPQTAIAIARPWRCPCLVQLLVRPTALEPNPGAADSRPSTAGPPSPEATCGNTPAG